MHLGTTSTSVVVVDIATAEPVSLPSGTEIVEVQRDEAWLERDGEPIAVTRHDITVELDGRLRPLLVASGADDELCVPEWPPTWVDPWGDVS